MATIVGKDPEVFRRCTCKSCASIVESEARRMKALSENSKQSTDYMQAQASLTIANAIAAGKVQTIIVPSNMTSLMLK